MVRRDSGAGLTGEEAAEVRRSVKRRAAMLHFLFFLGLCRLRVRRRWWCEECGEEWNRKPPASHHGRELMFEPSRNAPFVAWAHQVELARLLAAGEHVVVLKARQLGISWLLAAYVVWFALAQPGSYIMLLSMGQKESDELLAKVYAIWEKLPAWLVERWANEGPVSVVKHNKSKPGLLIFSNGSQVHAMPSTENAGRSFTWDLVVGDEAAFHEYADVNFDAYEPALDGGGQLVLVSTANGAHGFFHDQWHAAVAKASDLVALFIPWFARPDRTEVELDEDGDPVLNEDGSVRLGPSMRWYRRELARRPRTPAKARQEFPASPGEAFVAQTGLVYGMDTDGRMIFSRESYRPDAPKAGGNLSPDPVPWGRYRDHYGYVDWGGGGRTALGLIGYQSTGRVHQADEWTWEGSAPGAERIGQYFIEHAPGERFAAGGWGYRRILCGRDEQNSIQTLCDMGLPAVAANVNREEGIDVMTMFLSDRRFTLNGETCPAAVEEFDSFYWEDKLDPVSKSRYLTKTPRDHHADHKDGERYTLLEIHEMEMAFVDSPGGETPYAAVKLGRRR